jgi:hypothetical protein
MALNGGHASALPTLRADCLDGQISKNLSSPVRKNILLFSKAKSAAYLPPFRTHKRGARDRHERWMRNAMDANALLTNSAQADGEVVWS